MGYLDSIASQWPWLVAIAGVVIVILLILILLVTIVYLATRGKNLNPQPANNPGVVNPPAAGNRGWNFTGMSAPSTAVILIAVLVAFFVALYLRARFGFDLKWGQMWENEPIWFYLVGILLLALLVWAIRANSASVSSVSSTVTAYPKIFAMIGYILLLYVLVLTFFPESRELLLSGPGIGLLLAAILGYATFVIIRLVFWKDSWITAVILIFILALVLDMGIMRKVSPEGREEIHARLADFWPFVGHSCPGVAPTKPTVFGETSIPFNLNKCDTTYAVTHGCITFNGIGGQREVCASGNVIGRRDYFILTDAKASHGTAEMFYMLCPQGKGPLDGGWRCRS